MSKDSKPQILDSILDQIGNTPLVRLNKIPQSLGIEATIRMFFFFIFFYFYFLLLFHHIFLFFNMILIV